MLIDFFNNLENEFNDCSDDHPVAGIPRAVRLDSSL